MMKGLGNMSPDGRTEGRTDGHNGDYMLHRNFSGSIKIEGNEKLDIISCTTRDTVSKTHKGYLRHPHIFNFTGVTEV